MHLEDYKPVGGAIYNELLSDIKNALLEQESDDAALLLMGSNDVRWIADGRYRTKTATATRNSPWQDIDEIFSAAERGQGLLIISTPIPSPCHQRNIYRRNVWCQEEPCWHEKKTAKATKQLFEYISNKAKDLPNVDLIDLTTSFVHKDSFIANRHAFKNNNIHFKPLSASTLDTKVIQALSKYYQPQ